MLRLCRAGIAMAAVAAWFASAGLSAAADPYSWIGQTNGDGLWTTAGNWSTGVPGAGQVAVFSGTTATRAAVDLGAAGSVTVQGLTFDANLNNINITATAAGPPSLILNGGTLAAAVTVTGGQDTISAPVQFQSDVTVTTTNPSDALTFSGGGGGPYALLKQGQGIVTLSGSYACGNGVQTVPIVPGWGVTGGTLAIAGNTTVADGNSGAVSGGATLDITGTLTSGGQSQIIDTGTVTLRNAGTWNLRGSGVFAIGYDSGSGDVATLNITDSATLNVNRAVGLPAHQLTWLAGPRHGME